jgi:hypothetical protein
MPAEVKQRTLTRDFHAEVDRNIVGDAGLPRAWGPALHVDDVGRDHGYFIVGPTEPRGQSQVAPHHRRGLERAPPASRLKRLRIRAGWLTGPNNCSSDGRLTSTGCNDHPSCLLQLLPHSSDRPDFPIGGGRLYAILFKTRIYASESSWVGHPIGDDRTLLDFMQLLSASAPDRAIEVDSVGAALDRVRSRT